MDAEDQDKFNKPDDPIEAALVEFREAWFSGNRQDPDTFCRSHPECGPELRNKIEDFIFVACGFRDETGEGIDNSSGESCAGKLPQTLGDFKILHEIGKGGMGTVYEAEQVSLRRRVALKVLPPYLSFSDEAVLKFRREAEAGGRQSHPGIVAVYAVGEHGGAHYIAQELVEGGYTLSDKLEEFRNEELPQGYFRQVSSLVIEIADALQHAHESGVIHRDVKPSNILLTGEGCPKVTDFGLAKIEDALALSRTGDFAGTPYYMSPEQVASRRIGIDKRTDIYSLGVTLYEMLTFRRPFEGDTSHEVLKKIILMDPVDPSNENPQVPQDLSVICLKAMEKNPDRRYQSMSEFSKDLDRFLSGDVIHAKPASMGTRIWKRIKRKPVVSAMAGVAAVSLIVFSVVVPWVIAIKNQEKRELAEKAQEEIEGKHKEALAAAKESERQRDIARQEAEISRTVLDFMVGLFETPHPEKARGADISAKEILDRGVVNITDEFKDQPRIRTRLLHAMGRVYSELGIFDDAERLLREAYDIRRDISAEEHPDMFVILSNLGVLYKERGNYEEAETFLKKALEAARRVEGDNRLNTLGLQSNLGDLYRVLKRKKEAEILLSEALEGSRKHLGDDHTVTIGLLANLGVTYLDQERYMEAEPLLREAAERGSKVFGNDHPDTIRFLSNLSCIYMSQHRYEEAEPVLREALESGRKVLGNDHPDTLRFLGNLAGIYRMQGFYEKAEPLMKETIAGMRRTLGFAHPDTITQQYHYAGLCCKLGRFEQAESIHLETLDGVRRAVGDHHQLTLKSLYYTAHFYNQLGRYDEAESLFLEALEELRDALGDVHPSTLVAIYSLAVIYQKQRRYDMAEPLYLEALEGNRRVSADDDQRLFRLLYDVALFYFEQGRYDESEPYCLEAMEGQRRVLGDNHPDTLRTINNLGRLYFEQGRYDEAEPLYLENYEGSQLIHGKTGSSLFLPLSNLVELYKRQGRYGKAYAYAKELWELTPKDDPKHEERKKLFDQIKERMEETESTTIK